MVYVLESQMSEEEEEEEDIISTNFPTAKAAAEAAWELCEEYNLEMPNEGWYFDHPRYGMQDCYNMMVPAGHWEPDTAFIKFMSRQASRNGSVEISDGFAYIRIYVSSK